MKLNLVKILPQYKDILLAKIVSHKFFVLYGTSFPVWLLHTYQNYITIRWDVICCGDHGWFYKLDYNSAEW